MNMTEQTVTAANQRARQMQATYPVVSSASVVAATGILEIRFTSGIALMLPVTAIKGLADIPLEQLSTLELTPSGLGLHFPLADADVYIPALLEEFLGTQRWHASRLGKAGGSSASAAKQVAARNNGKRGGRPKKAKPAA